MKCLKKYIKSKQAKWKNLKFEKRDFAKGTKFMSDKAMVTLLKSMPIRRKILRIRLLIQHGMMNLLKKIKKKKKNLRLIHLIFEWQVYGFHG